MKYRKKPVVIEATQLCWRNWSEVCELLGMPRDGYHGRYIQCAEASDTCGEDTGNGEDCIAVDVQTMHGDWAVVRHGDWIVPDGKPGTFYPIKPDIFEATYEAVEE